MVDFERTRPTARAWDLTTIEALLRRPGAPPPPRPAVQVAGSKGKGSTAAWLEALVEAGGRRAGNYSSPHLVTLRERIRAGGQLVPVDWLEAQLSQLLVAVGDGRATFFELMTAAAAAWFAEQRVDLAIYEVGLGGRWDATTALPVDASLVTHIELEHTDVLGDTIAKIAAEKAAVIRPGVLGLTATVGEALAVMRARAAEVGTELLVAGEHFGTADVRFDGDTARGRLWWRDDGEQPFAVPGATAVTLPALALAATTLRRLLPDLPLQLEPTPPLRLPCRFEVFVEPDGEVLVLDGAHTEHSLTAVAGELQRRWPGRRPSVLFATAKGKRWREALSALLPIADDFVVTELSGTPGEDPATIVAWLAGHGAAGEVATDAESGLRRLRVRPGPRLVVGSFYLAGGVRALLGECASEPT
ncbi:MAG: hypothetical protein R3F29_12505 [Planctomycetota bacterium]